MKLLKFPQDESLIKGILEKTELASLMVPFTTESEVREACTQAINYGMASVLATPDICSQTVKLLAGSKVEPVCMISAMEIGDNDAESRQFLVSELIKMGVVNIDISVPTNMILDEEYSEITAEVAALCKLVHDANGKLGIILDIDGITREQLLNLCEAAIAGGADYLRTSSGMEQIGATDIGRATIYNTALLYEKFGSRIKIKAGGGWDFSYLEDCNEYLECGAVRVDAGPCMIRQLERIGYKRG